MRWGRIINSCVLGILFLEEISVFAIAGVMRFQFMFLEEVSVFQFGGICVRPLGV